MSRKNNKDYLYLIWKHPETRRHYAVGILSKNGVFEFEYGLQFEDAQRDGFTGIKAFEDYTKKYQNEKLFPVFASRLPDKKRRGIEDILKKYNLEEYDEYMLLKNSGARLPIDTFEFIDPIFDDEQSVSRYFYLAGVRHYLKCAGCDCSNQTQVNLNDKVNLVLEPENKYDENAVAVYNSNNEQIGYIPRYYSEQVTQKIKEGKRIECTVTERNHASSCRECIKVHLLIE